MGSDDSGMMSIEDALTLVKPVPGAERRPQPDVPTKEATEPDVARLEDSVPWRHPALSGEQVEVPEGQSAPSPAPVPTVDPQVVSAKDAQIAALERQLEEVQKQRFEKELESLPEEERMQRKVQYLEEQLADRNLRLERQRIKDEYPAATVLFGIVAPELMLTVKDPQEMRGVYEAMDTRMREFLSAYREEVEHTVEARYQQQYAEAWGSNSRLGLGNVSPSSVNAGGGPKPPAIAEYEAKMALAGKTGTEQAIMDALAARNKVSALQAGR